MAVPNINAFKLLVRNEKEIDDALDTVIAVNVILLSLPLNVDGDIPAKKTTED